MFLGCFSSVCGFWVLWGTFGFYVAVLRFLGVFKVFPRFWVWVCAWVCCAWLVFLGRSLVACLGSLVLGLLFYCLLMVCDLLYYCFAIVWVLVGVESICLFGLLLLVVYLGYCLCLLLLLFGLIDMLF